MYKPNEELRLTDQEILDLKNMRDHFWMEDTATRQQLLSKYRRLKFFWNNITNVWYDSVAHDWRVYDGNIGNDDSDQSYYDQRINVFRAYLESIIAALSVVVPPVKSYPDDADNARDMETAKAGDKIARLIYQHNDAPLFWLHSLFVYCTEGMVCGYNYAKHKPSYGTYKVDDYEDESTVHDITTCSNCGFELDDTVVTPEMQTAQAAQQEQMQSPQEQPQQEEQLQGLEQYTQPNPMQGMDICPSCNQVMTPQIERINVVIPKLVGSTDEPKGRVHLESYGGLNCKIPIYARKAEEVLYNFYSYETHYANAIQLFPKLHDKLRSEGGGNAAGAFDSYEQWARLSTEYRGEYPVNNVTIKQIWFRPSAFNTLEEAVAKKWKKKYPKGVSVVYINDLYAACYEQCMDEHWTYSFNPLSDFLVHDPLGMLLTSVQEITNDLISLTKQTIEHGVGLTFVDPQVVDLNAYNQTEVTPGSLIPTKPISGNKSIQDGFFEIKTATLSSEVMPFGEQIQSLGQLASGAIPSLFGGQIEGSGTASEYSMSKNSATSRLGTQYKTICTWWKNVMGKAIPMYIALVQTDEKDVQKREDGSFINVIIHKSELEGKIGKVELEANENLPITWAQKKDVVMQLLLSPNPQIIQMLMQPENLPVLREAIGLDNFTVPGADDVEKQWAEIQQLIESAPIETGDQMNPIETSVEVDVLMDTHPIHFEICRKWAVSEVGQFYKYNHPEQYQNIILHAKQHLDAQNTGIDPMMAQDPNAPVQNSNSPAGGVQPKEKTPKLNNQSAPISGDSNVPAAV